MIILRTPKNHSLITIYSFFHGLALAPFRAMKNPRVTVFAGAIAALAIMHVMASFFGYATTVIPRGKQRRKPFLAYFYAFLSRVITYLAKTHLLYKFLKLYFFL